ncbi:hypothetical protein HYFRA_00012646 [Hymenoscyphus fraxineus]|uniref:Uncharacterized protein n=1 Tax=Hymenoscyphus fraxineus TaxID=746836 RepID=A0A9N9PMR2_9HELO|nr:hypothetical protein HYFRA_00012646 [Hymenoscyphus fraxineus]
MRSDRYRSRGQQTATDQHLVTSKHDTTSKRDDGSICAFTGISVFIKQKQKQFWEFSQPNPGARGDDVVTTASFRGSSKGESLQAQAALSHARLLLPTPPSFPLPNSPAHGPIKRLPKGPSYFTHIQLNPYLNAAAINQKSIPLFCGRYPTTLHETPSFIPSREVSVPEIAATLPAMAKVDDFNDRQDQIDAENEPYHQYEYQTEENESWAGALPVKQ